MNFVLTNHAKEEIARRGIPVAVAHDVVHNPQQTVPGSGGKTAYQSKVDFGSKIFLVRAIVDDNSDPGVVITVYRTSRIAKYWRPE